MSFWGTLAGLASVAAPFIPGIGPALKAGIGAGAALLANHDAQHAQNKALGQQQKIAQGQQSLFNQAAPQYGQLLQQYGNYAQTGQIPQSYDLQHLNNLYLQQANQNIGHNEQRALHNFSFANGRRGLMGSSLDTGGRAAIMADANRQRSGFEQQLALNAPQMFEHRMGLLGNALNTGLGQGPMAAGIYGNQGGMYGNQAAGAQGSIASIMQNYQLLQALRGMGTAQGNPYQYTPGINGSAPNPLAWMQGATPYTPPIF